MIKIETVGDTKVISIDYHDAFILIFFILVICLASTLIYWLQIRPYHQELAALQYHVTIIDEWMAYNQPRIDLAYERLNLTGEEEPEWLSD